MEDDATLLRQYAETRSDHAFAEVVRRHVNLVYSAALRQVGGDAHLAHDVTQSVFTDLAGKAATVARCPVLAGWLHTSTHYAAAKAVRSERRRRLREQQAHAMQEILNSSAQDAEWSRLRPVLDVAIKQLPPEDRDAILLRFFEGRAFAAIGERLRLTENAARMRVERSLEKLRHELARRGIDSTSGALATVLVTQAVSAAPVPLASSITAAALTGTVATGAAASFLQFMTLTKTQITLASALLVGGGTTISFQQKAQATLHSEIARLEQQNIGGPDLREQNLQLQRRIAEARALQADATDLASLREKTAALRNEAAAAAILAAQREQAARAAAKNAAARAEPATNISATDHLPVIADRGAAPEYPKALRDAGITGEAVISFIVTADGEVKNPYATKSSHREFEAPALDAVRQWKFDPGVKAGRVVNTRMTVPIVFTLNDEDGTKDDEWF
jgi:RNA polymerase sigma factor (sigma-70 family)